MTSDGMGAIITEALSPYRSRKATMVIDIDWSQNHDGGVNESARYERLMRRALELAREAGEAGEVPIGCVVATGDDVIGEGANSRERDFDPTAHAEIVSIRRASRACGSWRLVDSVLVVTCEPCPMCAGAIVQARIPRVVFGCTDPKGGGVVSRYGIGVDGELNHRFELIGGVLEADASKLLREFFGGLRKRP